MEKGQVTRKLAAIVAMDVAGYSRLVAADEEGTVSALRSHRTNIITPRIQDHGGRIANTAGDSILIEFPSVIDAMRCSLELQAVIAKQNIGIQEERQIRFRLGVNVGDVIEQDGDLLGDGVNIAARLESLAEPGGIFVSARVQEDVQDKLDIQFQDLGVKKLKNIERPVQVYRVLRQESDASSQAVQFPSRLWLTWTAIATVCLAIAAGYVLGVNFWWKADDQETIASNMLANTALTGKVDYKSLSLPNRPSIAVLPFKNISGDPGQAYFADGIAENIITDLSKISSLFVISSHSSFRYRDRVLNLQKVAVELGVKYLLEGSVQRADNTIRVNAQLVEAATGGHLWAERYDGNMTNVFGLQDRITGEIVSVLALKLTSDEKQKLEANPLKVAEAYDFFLKGWSQYRKQTTEGFKEAIKHFERAVELDENYARALAALAATYWQIHRRFLHAKFGFQRVHDARFIAEEYLAKISGPPPALGHQVTAAMLSQQGRHTEAIAAGRKAIGLDPNDPDSYIALAGALNLVGQPNESMRLIGKAMRLNPHFPVNYLYELGLAQFGRADYQDAAKTLERAISINPEDRWSSRLLLAIYGHLGRKADAQRMFKSAEKNWIGNDPMSIRAIAFWYPFKKKTDSDRLAAGLRMANVPD